MTATCFVDDATELGRAIRRTMGTGWMSDESLCIRLFGRFTEQQYQDVLGWLRQNAKSHNGGFNHYFWKINPR